MSKALKIMTAAVDVLLLIDIASDQEHCVQYDNDVRKNRRQVVLSRHNHFESHPGGWLFAWDVNIKGRTPGMPTGISWRLPWNNPLYR